MNVAGTPLQASEIACVQLPIEILHPIFKVQSDERITGVAVEQADRIPFITVGRVGRNTLGGPFRTPVDRE